MLWLAVSIIIYGNLNYYMEGSNDKLNYCVRFILDSRKYEEESSPYHITPLFIGLTGIQGAGKTTLVSMKTRKPEEDSCKTLDASTRIFCI